MKLGLRDASIDDARFVWEVNNHPTVRAQSLSTGAISWESHLGWFERKLADRSAIFLIGDDHGEDVVVVRFDLAVSGEAVISVAVAPAGRGRGVGTKAIELATTELRRRVPEARAVAFIRPDNARSLGAFARAGYRRIGAEVRDGMPLERFECAIAQ